MKRQQVDPPEVLTGANFDFSGGVRGHLLGIKSYSSLRVQLAPEDSLLSRIGLYWCQVHFGGQFRGVNASGFSAIHSHVYPEFIEWCCFQQQQFGAYWVHTYHNHYYPEFSRGALEPWMVRINDSLLNTARFADVRISVSRWQQQELRDLHSIETVYIPNGVDAARCLQGSAERFKKVFGLDRFILYVGRDDPVKNPEEFVQLALRMPDVPCVMIGGGLTPARVSELCGVVPRNLRILGPKSFAVVHDALAAASVVVVTSKREGLPTLVLEAMVHEKPVVVPEERGCSEAVNHGQFGSIYTLGDLDDLEKKVRAVLAQRGPNRGALQHVRREYDWSVTAAMLDRIYRRETPVEDV
jgi:glycosyltransferase involved in cell wall biosynthesis